MKDIVLKLDGDEFKRMYEIDRDMMIFQTGAVSYSLEDARDLHDRWADIWQELREEHDLKDEESYIFDRQTGHVFVDKFDE